MVKKLLALVVLIIYIAILIKIMVFKDLPTVRVGILKLNFAGTREGEANLIPFKTILPYLMGYKGLLIAGINLIGNIVLLVPVGVLAPLIAPNFNWKKSLIIALLSGLSIELTQVILKVGIFDIDDVLLNALGVMIGYWLLELYFRLEVKLFSKYRLMTSLVALVFLLAAYLIFIRPSSPFSIGLEKESIRPVHLERTSTGEIQGEDPCGGTGGTGVIISIESSTIHIKRRDGKEELIYLDGKTKIQNSMGPVKETDLKLGQHVTLVVGEEQAGKRVASYVLICNLASKVTQKN